MYSDDKVVVYLGYPAEVSPSPPRWMDSLTLTESRNLVASPYRFYLSGGIVTNQLLEVLKNRASNIEVAQKLCLRLTNGYTSRLIDSILSPSIELCVKRCQENPLSTEFRVLLDLWVMSRSDVYVVDCDLLGKGRLGMETVYAHDCIKTVGVSDSPVLDPWYQYHLDSIIKSQMCLSFLTDLRPLLLSRRLVQLKTPDGQVDSKSEEP
jgi:hypothetical protein